MTIWEIFFLILTIPLIIAGIVVLIWGIVSIWKEGYRKIILVMIWFVLFVFVLIMMSFTGGFD